MHAYLNHPAIVAFLAPLLAALLTAELFQRLRLSGLSILAGFALTVFLISDFAYAPLTATRKIIWLGIASGALALPITLVNWAIWRPILATLAASAAVWVLLHALQQQILPTAMLWGISYALFSGWLVFWMDTLQDDPVRAASAGTALGLGTAAALLIAGYGLLGKLNLAVGAAALAYLFILFVSNSLLSCGRTFTLPLAIISALSASVAAIAGN
ncbi:MAG TPA: hypothetical protein VIN71_07205, partial [Pseudomonadales bacterium]